MKESFLEMLVFAAICEESQSQYGNAILTLWNSRISRMKALFVTQLKVV